MSTRPEAQEEPNISISFLADVFRRCSFVGVGAQKRSRLLELFTLSLR